jgi:hypothetical protein
LVSKRLGRREWRIARRDAWTNVVLGMRRLKEPRFVPRHVGGVLSMMDICNPQPAKLVRVGRQDSVEEFARTIHEAPVALA